MMQPQDLIVAVLVLAAGVYLARSAWRTLVPKQAGGCTGCGTGCKAPPDVVRMGHASQTDQIVTLDLTGRKV